MKKLHFFTYLRLQWKRTLRYLPPILGATAILLAAALLFGMTKFRAYRDDDARRKINVGVAGDLENRWVKLGMEMLEKMDSSRYVFSFLPMDETTALRRLRAGTISAYAVIPEGFAHGLATGNPVPIRYVSTEGAVGIDTMLTDEIVRLLGKLLLETENSVYGAQDYIADHFPKLDPDEEGNTLAATYMRQLLMRENLFRVEIVGLGNGLGFVEYYVCALLLLLLLLWGLACAPMFFRRSAELRRMLAANGLKPWAQVLAEYLAYLALLLPLLLALVLAVGGAAAPLEERLGVSLANAPVIAKRIFMPALVFAALQLLLFELANDPVGAMLTQFVTAIVMGFASGCFYPAGFLPEALRRFGEVLPSGAAMRWLSTGEPKNLFPLAAYGVGFLLLLALRRRRVLEGSGAG